MMNENENEQPEEGIDESLVPLGDMIAGLLPQMEQGFEESISMQIEEIAVEIPIEIDAYVNESSGRVRLGSSPPVYYLSTTVSPVLHQLKITIQQDGNEFN